MRSPRSIVITVFVALIILAGAWSAQSYRSSRLEEMQIRARYEQMRLALSSRNTNAARALFTPDHRGAAHRDFEMLARFAKPLGPQSSVGVSGSRAQVCPERVVHYRILPGGNTIEMVKVDGEWFFTGGIHID